MKTYIETWYPEKMDGVWGAVGQFESLMTGKVSTVIFFDYNGDKLDLIDEQFAISWCNTRNEIEKIL